MKSYPKIETLYDRDEKTHGVIPGQLRLSEFELITSWHVTEKIDGTNIRVVFDLVTGSIEFGGRTDNAQIPANLVAYLTRTFTVERFMTAFDGTRVDDNTQITLFGEGYGEKIQKCGGQYRKGVAFRLFDVYIGDWWLEWNSVEDIAEKLGIKTVPYLGEVRYLPSLAAELREIVDTSQVAWSEDGDGTLKAEGIVARTRPLLLTRAGKPLVWKLKFRDFE